MKTVLCIGGLDPAGYAGLVADATAVAAMGAHPLCVATALTFQSSKHMEGYEPMLARVLERQLEILLRDEAIDVVKVGMLATAELAAVVSRLPANLRLVLDTPLVSSGGSALFPLDSLGSYGPLIRRAELVTPNLPELCVLAGQPLVETREAALLLAAELGAKAVLVKGGHFPDEEVVDVLVTDARRLPFRSPRLPGRFRGTGCRLASAIAARLAQGDALTEAIVAARSWLQGRLAGEGSQ